MIVIEILLLCILCIYIHRNLTFPCLKSQTIKHEDCLKQSML